MEFVVRNYITHDSAKKSPPIREFRRGSALAPAHFSAALILEVFFHLFFYFKVFADAFYAVNQSNQLRGE